MDKMPSWYLFFQVAHGSLGTAHSLEGRPPMELPRKLPSAVIGVSLTNIGWTEFLSGVKSTDTAIDRGTVHCQVLQGTVGQVRSMEAQPDIKKR